MSDRGIKPLLKEFRSVNKNNTDRALYHLLARFEGELPRLDYRFHGSFRNSNCVDVKNGAHMDIAIYCLLDESEVFWELYEKYNLDEVTP